MQSSCGNWRGTSGCNVAILKAVMVVFLVLGVVACAPRQHEAFIGATGRTSYVVECFDDEKNCIPQAEALCPHGYNIVGSKSQLVAIWRGMDVVNRIRFKLTIECNE
jgi:hypothetical protein